MPVEPASRVLTADHGHPRELDRVTLAVAVATDEGGTLPAGSIGTIVGRWANGTAFEVEFTRPFPALATVEAGQIATYHWING